MTIFVSIDSMTELTAVTPVTTDAEGQRLLLYTTDAGTIPKDIGYPCHY